MARNSTCAQILTCAPSIADAADRISDTIQRYVQANGYRDGERLHEVIALLEQAESAVLRAETVLTDAIGI